MHKTPSYRFGYAPIGLPKGFPFCVSGLFEQHDREITSLHAHDVIEFGICLDGSGIFVVEDKVLPFREGDVSVITSKETHLARSRKGTTSHWYWIYANLEKILYPAFHNSELVDTTSLRGPSFRNIISPSEHPKICSLIKELVEIQNGEKRMKNEKITSVLCLLMAELGNEFKAGLKRAHANAKDTGTSCFEPDTLHRLQKAVACMAGRYNEQLRIPELARMSGLSMTHFRRLFQNALGRSPMQYLAQVRVAMASAELRNSRKPVGMISIESGFPTLSCFNRQFRKTTGKSPGQWRKLH